MKAYILSKVTSNLMSSSARQNMINYLLY